MRFPSLLRRWTGRVPRLAVALAVLAGGCSGPKTPLNIGARPVTLDVLLGARTAVARAPVPPASFVLGPSGFPSFSFDFETPNLRPVRPALPRFCLDPAAVPPEGPPYALLAPPGKYTYKASGAFRVGGADARETPVPDTATVEVFDPRITTETLSMSLYWKTAVTLGGVKTTTSYRSTIPLLAREVAEGQFRDGIIYPKLPDERANWPEGDPLAVFPPAKGTAEVPPYPAPATSDVAQPPRGVHYGLYLEAMETRAVDDAVAAAQEVDPGAAALGVFRPAAPGLLLAKYPLEVGSAFDVTGADEDTTMSYRATVRPKATVRSCLFVFDTWTIELTRGKVVDSKSGEAVDFTARYQLATGFGGLVVEDQVEVTGRQADAAGVVPIHRTLQTTFERLG